MNQRRTTVRWFVGFFAAGGLLLSGVAVPVQAATTTTGLNRPVTAHKVSPGTPPRTGGHTPADTGWNGT